MYYFGIFKNNKMVEVFYSKNKPSLQSHGDLYNLVYGGYKTRQIATDKANYQYTQPVVFFDSRKKECHNTRNLCMIANII